MAESSAARKSSQRHLGSSATDVFAVGGNTIYHYDGTEWSATPAGQYTFYSVWGSSAHDVFAVGSTGRICTMGCYYLPVIYHYNGTSWSPMTPYLGLSGLNCVWGSSATDVFAVGNDGLILHYDGTTWSQMSSGTTNPLYGVWGSSSTDVYAVGQGSMLHYNGSSWSPVQTGYPAYFRGVWGSSADNVFAVGYTFTENVILRFDGNSWATMTMTPPSDCGLCAVWGSSGSDVFAVGVSGTILHYAGTPTLIELTSFTTASSHQEVILSWSTASEIDNAGFNIYRASPEGGEFVKINAALIPAKGSSTQGAEYAFVDSDVKNRKTYWYKLEDIAFNGTATMHGPVTATPRLIFGTVK